MKKAMILVLCAAMLLLTLAGCGPQTKPEAEKTVVEVSIDGPKMGGWRVNDGDTSMEANPEAEAALNKALEGLVGASYEPIACLGTQVVAGTNYCILCRVTPVAPNAEATLCLVYVFAALDGSAEILDTQDITLGL